MSGGANFRINHNRMIDSLDEELLNDEIGSDDETESADLSLIKSPWTKPFDELREHMVKLPSANIYKRVVKDGVGDVMGERLCQVQWQYNMFLESQHEAFDSSFASRGKKIIKFDEVLEGVWLSLETMRAGEESQFVIDHKLMFGNLGVPPRIPPKADILLTVTMVRFDEVGVENPDGNLTDEDRRKFVAVKPKAVDMLKNSLNHFREKRFARAANVAHSAIQRLEFCSLADEAEQAEQKELLIELYVHLTDCYNSMDEWKKTCSMVNELRRLCKVEKHIKVLLNEGIALSKLDEYEKALKLLRTAQQIDPHNTSVNKALKSVLETRDKHKKEERSMWQRAFQAKQALPKTATVDTDSEKFAKQFMETVASLEEGARVPLVGYTPNEIKTAKLLAKKVQGQLKICDDGNNNYTVVKTKAEN